MNAEFICANQMKTHNVWVEPPSLAKLEVRLRGRKRERERGREREEGTEREGESEGEDGGERGGRLFPVLWCATSRALTAPERASHEPNSEA